MQHRIHIALRTAIIASRLSQIMQLTKAPHIAFAARRHAIAQPIFFTGNFTIKLMLRVSFALQFTIAPIFKMAEIFAHEFGFAAIKPDSLIGHIAQKAAVMTDQHQRRI
ncbi:MAG: hypothetical protein VW950_00960, partial [Rhodobiaceae bacterium]